MSEARLPGFYPIFGSSCLGVLIITLAGLLQYAHAVPAYPYPIDYTQPDSSTITIQLFGDEFVSWRETADGYTLLFSKDGFLEYAEQNGNGDIKPSGVRARNELERTEAEKKFLDGLPKKLWFSPSQVKAMRNKLHRTNNIKEVPKCINCLD